MASGPMLSRQVDGGNNGNGERLYFLGSKIAVDGGCSIKLKDTCFLEEKL